MTLGLVFATTACDPLEDIYEDIDAQETAVVGDAEYTLTDDDYDALDLGYGSFSSEEDVKADLPEFLSEKYPVWGKGSSVLVGYNLYVGNAEGVSDYTGANEYELADDDYDNAGDDAATYNVFTAASPADLNVPSILAANIDAPASGDILLAKYKYAEEPNDPSIVHTLVNDDYMLIVNRVANNSDPAISSLVSSYGDSELYTGAGAYYGNFDTRLSKREGQPDFDALTTDEEKIALIEERLQIGIVWFLKDKFPNAVPEIDGLTVFYAITYKTYNGENSEPTVIYKCISEGPDPEFELVEGPGEDVAYQASTVTESRGEYYTYSGSEWEKASGVYYLWSRDFDSMGEASGQPGKYNNFGSSISPDDYLPTFLDLKLPYAQEEDELFVIYDYYSSSSGAQIRGNLYTVIDGVWTGHKSTTSSTLQFGHDGTTWVPDNTIKYTLVGDDYVYMADQLTGVSGYEDLVGSLGKYKDFDYNWTEDQIVEALGIIADKLNPNAEEGQKYLFTYLLYDSGIQELSMKLIKEGGVWNLYE